MNGLAEFHKRREIVEKELSEDGVKPTREQILEECIYRRNAGLVPFGDYIAYEGLIYLRVYREKDGETTELPELEENFEEPEHILEYFSNKIYGIFDNYLNKEFKSIVKKSFQVELYTRNAGPLIDYCVYIKAPKHKTPLHDNFKIHLRKKVGDATYHVTTTLLPSTETDFGKMLRASVAKYLI